MAERSALLVSPETTPQNSGKETAATSVDSGAVDLWPVAVAAAESKKAVDLAVLDLREITSFTEYFVVCSGTNQRQNQAICDEVHARMKQQGSLPLGMEGYDHAEWILMDYGDFIVHIFSPQAREYYDLERLWRSAKRVEPADEAGDDTASRQ
jgi:ribosome-associated protein